ncbi:MAG: undecaprenyldiphospho-muramoylpentapeptide beta-N-acetylglucosaminyltransferase [Myxococcota bacterium]
MKMLIAGGGTGGHLFPGVAVAEEVLSRKAGNEVLFVGTRRGLEARVIPRLGHPIEYVEVSGLKGTGLGRRLGGFAQLPGALMQSMAAVRRFDPDVAVGVGGYASGPAIMAAWMLGVPCALLEQNSVPGVTNRILSRFAQSVFTTFPVAAGHFPPGKVQPLGNPIRKQLLANFLDSGAGPSEFTVLVLGGSQGAHGLNLRVADAVARLKDQPVRWVHQAGGKDAEELRRRYAECGAAAEVHEFIEDMSAAYRQASLVLCRAGASTLAEVMVAKKPSVLVPFPFATDNHQELNARVLEEAEAAIVLLEGELDGLRLAEVVDELRQDPSRLAHMARAAGRLGRPEAAREVVDACEAMASR